MHNSGDVTELKGLLRDLTKQLATTPQDGIGARDSGMLAPPRQHRQPSSTVALENLFQAARHEERAELASRVADSAARVSGLGLAGGLPSGSGVGSLPAPCPSPQAGNHFRVEDGATQWTSDEGDALMKGWKRLIADAMHSRKDVA